MNFLTLYSAIMVLILMFGSVDKSRRIRDLEQRLTNAEQRILRLEFERPQEFLP